MTSCTHCGIVPNALPEAGTLILVGLSEDKAKDLISALAIYGIVPTSLEGGLLSVDLFQGCFEIILDWSRLLSERLIEEGRYILLAPGEELALSHMSRVRPLSDLLKHVKNAWVLDMVRENRLTSYYHPIVAAGQPNEIHAHECLMRGIAKDGSLVPPGVVLDAADAEGMIFHLDRACRINAIKGFAGQGVPGKAFINFNPVSVYNPIACLQSTVAAAKSVGLPPERIVFELIERNHVADEAHLLRIVDFYRAAGYGVDRGR